MPAYRCENSKRFSVRAEQLRIWVYRALDSWRLAVEWRALLVQFHASHHGCEAVQIQLMDDKEIWWCDSSGVKQHFSKTECFLPSVRINIHLVHSFFAQIWLDYMTNETVMGGGGGHMWFWLPNISVNPFRPALRRAILWLIVLSFMDTTVKLGNSDGGLVGVSLNGIIMVSCYVIPHSWINIPLFPFVSASCSCSALLCFL